METVSGPISSIADINENDSCDDEEEEEIVVSPDDEVLDEVDIDDGVAFDDLNNENWSLTDFMAEDGLPSFDEEWGVNAEKMIEKGCTSCLDTFSCYFDENIMDTFVNSTQNFGSNMFGAKWRHTLTVNEFKSFLAVTLVLGLIPIGSRDSVWDGDGLGVPFIKNLMTKSRFNQILRAWRYEDESGLTNEQINRNVKEDPFWYVTRFIEELQTNFQEMYTLAQKVDIDEQCIAWSGRHSCRCYNPNKPEKWHFKLYALNCALTGYMINMYLYRGKAEKRPNNVPATLYPIQKLFQPIELYYNKKHIVATDNWYTSMAALEYVRDTLRNDFVGTCKANKQGIPKDGLFPKVGRGKQRRGAHKQMMKNDNGRKAYFTAWQDNKPVHILSTIKSGLIECHRRLQNETTKQWERVTYPQPSIIKVYNKTMGGTDSFDQRLSYFRPSVKTRRYPPRIFVHFLNASVVNASIIHKQFHKTPKTFQLRQFIKELVFDLVPQVSREIPNLASPVFRCRLPDWEKNRDRLNTTLLHIPFIEENPDETSHDKHYRSECVLCGKSVNMRCVSCGAYLCAKGKDHKTICFMLFHTQRKLKKK